MNDTIHLNPSMMTNLCREALAEDIGSGDATTLSVIPDSINVSGQLITRESCIIAGLPLVEKVFHVQDSSLTFESKIADSQRCINGQVIGTVSGQARSILTAERTALNFIQHLSGIATLTNKYVDALSNSKTKILDTRKTTPGLRLLEKYAVSMGGGTNHRHGLYDRIMIKDNHLFIASLSGVGVIKEAITTCRSTYPNLEIEVEIDTLDQLEEALMSGTDYILLDNMSAEEMSEAVKLRDQLCAKTLLEGSGGITLERIPEIASIGLDFISVGELTHSVNSIDIGLDFQCGESKPFK